MPNRFSSNLLPLTLNLITNSLRKNPDWPDNYPVPGYWPISRGGITVGSLLIRGVHGSSEH